MYSNDLVPMFGESKGPQLRFRQGVVVVWDSATGANVVDVGGTQISNVPILNTGEAIALKAGHIVGLLGIGGSFWILGRITVPNDPNFASATVGIETGGTTVSGFGVNATLGWVAVASTTIPAPSWADEAIVNVTAMASLHNTRAVLDFMELAPYVQSFQGPISLQGYAPGDINSQSATYCAFLTGPFGGSIPISARINPNGSTAAENWGASTFNTAYVFATATYRSVT